jgi:hypothetical protein
LLANACNYQCAQCCGKIYQQSFLFRSILSPSVLQTHHFCMYFDSTLVISNSFICSVHGVMHVCH